LCACRRSAQRFIFDEIAALEPAVRIFNAHAEIIIDDDFAFRLRRRRGGGDGGGGGEQ